MAHRKLLNESSDAKTVKGEALKYMTGILYLTPSDLVDGVNLCPFASKGCREACLYSAGRGKFSNVKQGRQSKTELFRDDLEFFMFSLVKEIMRVKRKAARQGMTPVIRLNGTSDIKWENIILPSGNNIFEEFPDTQFYDYTKDWTREKALEGYWSNYHLTFSWSEDKRNQKKALEFIDRGINVAIVFDKVPEVFRERKVINGDETDLRFLDGRGVVVGLKAKGDAKKDTSGFVFKG